METRIILVNLSENWRDEQVLQGGLQPREPNGQGGDGAQQLSCWVKLFKQLIVAR